MGAATGTLMVVRCAIARLESSLVLTRQTLRHLLRASRLTLSPNLGGGVMYSPLCREVRS
jgi:hypothetical protein